MKLYERTIAMASMPDEKAGSLSFPGLLCSRSGRLFITARRAPSKDSCAHQRVALCYSDDLGHTWSSPAEPFQPPVFPARQGLFRAAFLSELPGNVLMAALLWVDNSDPSLEFFDPETESLLDCKLYKSFSHDNGQSWSRPEIQSTPGFEVPTPITGAPLVWPDGEVLWHFELNKPYGDTSKWMHRSVAASAHMGGAIERHSSVTAEPRVFDWDLRPLALHDGKTVIDYFWTYDTERQDYLPIHYKISQDRGRSWGAFHSLGFNGQPGYAAETADGRIVLPYTDRSGRTPEIHIRISDDGGRSFLPESDLLLAVQPDVEQSQAESGSMRETWNAMFAFSLGYPGIAVLPDNSIGCCYYAGAHAGATAVEFLRFSL